MFRVELMRPDRMTSEVALYFDSYEEAESFMRAVMTAGNSEDIKMTIMFDKEKDPF